MTVEKIDSNITGLAFAEEASLKVLPGSPIWRALEPNSYKDFGGNITTVARQPIVATRQRKKGTVTGLEVGGGFDIDYTQNNLTRLLQGFFFAAAHEKLDTQPLNAAAVTITEVNAGSDDFITTGVMPAFPTNALIFASGFGVPSNNGVHVVASHSGTTVVVAEAVTEEASPPAAARLHQCGVQGTVGDITLAAGATPQALSTTLDFTTLGLNVGEWVFVGDDLALHTAPLNAPFYARVLSIAAHVLTFDKTTVAIVNDACAGNSVRIYFGTFMRNESDPTLIVRKTFQLERTLGFDDNGQQAEYLVGSVANEMTINIPQKDKLHAELSFVGLDNVQRDGTQGLLAGTRVGALGEDAYNTSTDVYRIKMAIVDPTTSLPSPLFGYVTEAKIDIKNNVKPNDAVGVLGAFDTTAGNFEVGGNVQAYFNTVTAVRAVRQNANVTIDCIISARNAGFVLDIPLMGLGGGRLNVVKDAPILLPIENNAAQCAAGYTLSKTIFAYLPTIASNT